MTPRPRTFLMGRAVALTTPAGPTISVSGAAATVARLRKAARWTDPYLANLTGLDEAARRVSSSRTLVIDRRAAVDVFDDIASRFLGSTEYNLPLFGASFGLRTLVHRSMGLWDPFNGRRVLIAPNVLAASENHTLDQIDYCRWVALRAGLWGVHFEHAPFLVDVMADMVSHLPSRISDFMRLILLLEALPTAQMEVLTPRDIASIGWIRHHRAESVGVVGLQVLHEMGFPNVDIGGARERAARFAQHVVTTNGLPLLLSSPDALPTAEEFADPSMWQDRVRH